MKFKEGSQEQGGESHTKDYHEDKKFILECQRVKWEEQERLVRNLLLQSGADIHVLIETKLMRNDSSLQTNPEQQMVGRIPFRSY